jgi:ketosteroid isomerase-like protein
MANAAQARSSGTSAQEAITRLGDTFIEHYNKHDAAGLVAAYYTKDAVLVTQATPEAKGYAEAKGFYTGTEVLIQRLDAQFKAGTKDFIATFTRIEPLGDNTAIAWGDYHATRPGQDGPITIEGNWSATYVREDGAWKARILNVIPRAPAPTR